MTPLLALAFLQTPDAAGTARAYAEALAKGDFEAAARMVEGGIYSEPAAKLGRYFRMAPLLSVVGVDAIESGDAATVTVRLKAFDGDDQNELALARRNGTWRVVPRMLDFRPGTKKYLEMLTAGFVQPTVFLAILAPLEARVRRLEDLSGIKQLGIALLMWLADQDDRFPKVGTDLGLVLRNYVKDKALLERLKPKNGVRWRLNPVLAGKPTYAVADPARFVMLYEEFNGKPGLGPDRRELIVTVDGRAFLADADRLKKCVWTLPR